MYGGNHKLRQTHTCTHTQRTKSATFWIFLCAISKNVYFRVQFDRTRFARQFAIFHCWCIDLTTPGIICIHNYFYHTNCSAKTSACELITGKEKKIGHHSCVVLLLDWKENYRTICVIDGENLKETHWPTNRLLNNSRRMWNINENCIRFCFSLRGNNVSPSKVIDIDGRYYQCVCQTFPLTIGSSVYRDKKKIQLLRKK